MIFDKKKGSVCNEQPLAMNAGYCILKICVHQAGTNIATGINSRIAAITRLALATSIKGHGHQCEKVSHPCYVYECRGHQISIYPRLVAVFGIRPRHKCWSFNHPSNMMPMNQNAVGRSTMIYINRRSKLLLKSTCLCSKRNRMEGFKNFTEDSSGNE